MNEERFEPMITKARQAGDRVLVDGPQAARVEYLEDSNELLLELVRGASVRVPVNELQGLRDAGPIELREFELTPDGMAVHWDELDAHFTVPGLVKGIFGTKAWMRAIGEKGGNATSEEKRRAARENGKRGGRPSRTSIADVEPRGGKFQLRKPSRSRFLVRLIAPNGRELLVSPEFDSRDEAVAWTRAIKGGVQRNSVRFDLQSQPQGARLKVYDTEDHLLGTSRTYSAKSTASRAKATIASTILGSTLDTEEDNSKRHNKKLRRR